MSQSWVNRKRIWVVGGSEGIGLCLVEQLLNAGTKVVVSARKAESNEALLALRQQFVQDLQLLDCDVTDMAVMSAKIHQAWCFFEGLDAWFYNVGLYDPMTLSEWDFTKFERMNQANYLGVVAMMTELLPKFIQQGEGRWLWNNSLASDFGLPYGGGYSAPKAALQNLAESLQPELKAEGITLQVVNHGFVKTRLTAKNDFPMLGLMTPEAAADRIFKVFDSRRFETRFPANLAWVLGGMKRLPKSWALALTKKMLKPTP